MNGHEILGSNVHRQVERRSTEDAKKHVHVRQPEDDDTNNSGICPFN